MKEKPTIYQCTPDQSHKFLDNLFGSQPRLPPQLQSSQNLFLCEESYELIRVGPIEAIYNLAIKPDVDRKRQIPLRRAEQSRCSLVRECHLCRPKYSRMRPL